MVAPYGCSKHSLASLARYVPKIIVNIVLIKMGITFLLMIRGSIPILSYLLLSTKRVSYKNDNSALSDQRGAKPTRRVATTLITSLLVFCSHCSLARSAYIRARCLHVCLEISEGQARRLEDVPLAVDPGGEGQVDNQDEREEVHRAAGELGVVAGRRVVEAQEEELVNLVEEGAGQEGDRKQDGQGAAEHHRHAKGVEHLLLRTRRRLA